MLECQNKYLLVALGRIKLPIRGMRLRILDCCKYQRTLQIHAMMLVINSYCREEDLVPVKPKKWTQAISLVTI